MSGAHALHTRGALKAKVLQALGAGPMSTAKLATAIGYELDSNSLSVTLRFHADQGTIVSGPHVPGHGRMLYWGLPGATWPDVPAPTVRAPRAPREKKPKPLPKREQHAIAYLVARGYSVSKASAPIEHMAPVKLAAPAREPLIQAAPAPKVSAPAEDVEAFLARGGRIEVLPLPTPVPLTVLPAFRGTR